MTLNAAILDNWIAIYLLTSWLCLVAASLAAISVALDVWRKEVRPRTIGGWIALVPRLWWRWQLRYWLGTPAILAIVGAFGASLEWRGS